MLSFSFACLLPFGAEFATYAAPHCITGCRRLFHVDTTFMADANCWARVTVLGRCFEFYGPEAS